MQTITAYTATLELGESEKSDAKIDPLLRLHPVHGCRTSQALGMSSYCARHAVLPPVDSGDRRFARQRHQVGANVTGTQLGELSEVKVGRQAKIAAENLKYPSNTAEWPSVFSHESRFRTWIMGSARQAFYFHIGNAIWKIIMLFWHFCITISTGYNKK